MTPFLTIKILSWILAGYYSMIWPVECSDLPQIDGSPDDLLQYSTSSVSEGLSSLETTLLPDYDDQTSQVSVEEDILKTTESNTFDPVFENVSLNDSEDGKSNSKRDTSAFQGKWNHANKMKILQLHNLYRGNVTPPAGDMAYLEWDTELERLAQLWANNCTRNHGGYNTTLNIGQNIDIDTDPTGYHAIYRWHEEGQNYDLQTGSCLDNKKCWHYRQMVWAESFKLGCAVAKCGISYYFVCYYIPGNVDGVQIYQVSEPCSRCSGKNVLCLKNMCMTQEQCKNNPFACQDAECNLKCHNCGHLNNETCTCECPDGWEGRDCSQLCKNKHKMCGKNPGYPDKKSCPDHKYAVANKYCRKMCETCRGVQETSSYTCCEAKLCDEGYILDPSGKTCECVLHCPGPACDCPSFKIRKGLSIVYSKSEGGEIEATFSCQNNTKLIGSNTSKCRFNGTWSLSSPYCEDITCPLFKTGENINVEYSGSNKVDSMAIFSCQNNTKLVGSNTSECQLNGKWSHSMPYCEGCPLFEVGKDISIEYSESDTGASVAAFICHNNTKLVGFKTSECQPDGKWSNSLPYCEYDAEAILNLAAVLSGGAESLRTFPCTLIWIVILKLIIIYIHKHT